MIVANAPIFSVADIRKIEKLAADELQLSGQALMQAAGKAAFDALIAHFPQTQKIAVFVGNGNNGGDGYVLAEVALAAGMEVMIYPVDKITADTQLAPADVVVDAITGIGLETVLRPALITLLERIEAMQCPIVAIDIPTGINADKGCVLGKALHADLTVTFIGLKLGLLTGHGVSYAGKVVCDDLGISRDVLDTIKPVAKQLNIHDFRHLFKKRAKDWHKGLSGHVLIIGGEVGFAGAPEMAALAALRIGAGLVSVATRKEHAEHLSGYVPEVMCHGVQNGAELKPLLQKADVIVIGPGLGQSEWSLDIWRTALAEKKPLVVDADGLNILAQHVMQNRNWILTPHPGEAARLLALTNADIQNDRLQAVTNICSRYSGICVLKGAGSLIASNAAMPMISTYGNPGMATAGMGDVLSGVLGGLLAQGLALQDAADVGVAIHAYAGDLAAIDGERGMIATDLMPYLRKIVNMLQEEA